MRNAGRADTQARARLHARLCERRAEIEEAALTRVYAISDPGGVPDPTYAEALRAAVATALDYGFVAVERSEDNPPPIPPALLAQARIAARGRVELDAVLRRYLAGYAVLVDHLIDLADEELDSGPELKAVLHGQASVLDRLLAAVSVEYAREASGRIETSEQRRAERVRRLLAGESLDTHDLAYDFDCFHLAILVRGAAAASRTLARVAAALDCRLLLVQADERTNWAWLGSSRRPDPTQLVSQLSSVRSTEVALSIGEPAEGLAGWRLTHRQAAAALVVALRGPRRVVRYADVALVASALQDDLLTASLHRLYLAPLRRMRDLGAAEKDTLRAYLAAGRNVSSAAAALGVSRRTVTNRLRGLEEALGQSLNRIGAEVEIALRLDELDAYRIAGTS